ncbi:hypothetical protein NCPPB3778_26 [Rathayibacter phage NCPPB3778]|nr:hypothetical protein NCPPB3778_26 [Rathayibacter phage NCPPB3778]
MATWLAGERVAAATDPSTADIVRTEDSETQKAVKELLLPGVAEALADDSTLGPFLQTVVGDAVAGQLENRGWISSRIDPTDPRITIITLRDLIAETFYGDIYGDTFGDNRFPSPVYKDIYLVALDPTTRRVPADLIDGSEAAAGALAVASTATVNAAVAQAKADQAYALALAGGTGTVTVGVATGFGAPSWGMGVTGTRVGSVILLRGQVVPAGSNIIAGAVIATGAWVSGQKLAARTDTGSVLLRTTSTTLEVDQVLSGVPSWIELDGVTLNAS